jgi:type I restriction enzyme S subunit
MNNTWKIVVIGHCCKLQGGYAFKSKDFSVDGIPVVKIKNIQGVTATLEGSQCIPIEKKSSKLDKFLLKNGDILIAMTGAGSVGRVGKLRCLSSDISLLNQRVGRFDVDSKLLDKDYLYYHLTKKSFQKKLFMAGSGSGQPNLSPTQILSFQINLPPLPEQKAIAHILGTLDDKIELNRKMNETLEAMAQAMFKSWFVDFDPVIDNALAKGNAIPEELKAKAARRKAVLESGQYKALPKDIQALFPASFVYNEELGKWIPEGWTSVALYETANYINGSSFKSKDFNGERRGKPIIKIAELKSGIKAQTNFTDSTFDEKYIVNKGDLLYSWSGSPDTSLNTFIWSGTQGWLNQHIFAVKTESFQQKTFVFNLLNFLKPTLIAIAKDKQTTGLGHVTVKDMKNLHIATCHNESQLIEVGLENIFRKQIKLQGQVVELTKLRDTLLSQLISGKTRLPASFVQQFESKTEPV